METSAVRAVQRGVVNMGLAEVREAIAKVIYSTHCGVPDEIDREWEEAGKNWQDNCLYFADEILSIIRKAGYKKIKMKHS